MKLLLKIVLTATLLRKVDSKFGTLPDSCLDTRSKDAPSNETEEFPECKLFQDMSCCTIDKARQIHEDVPKPLRIMTPICGNFTDECTRYQKAIRCWHQCEPMLLHYQHENWTHIPHQAPICGRYCDDWFKACEGDRICVGDWREGFAFNPDSRDCPEDGSKCVTYAEMYGDGEGLCNTIYSTTLKYEASNTNCMVMLFEGDNPNIHGNPYGSANKLTSSLLVCLLGLWLISQIL